MNVVRIGVVTIFFVLLGAILLFILFQAQDASIREELAKEENAVEEMYGELRKAIESQKRDLARRVRPSSEVESVVEYGED